MWRLHASPDDGDGWPKVPSRRSEAVVGVNLGQPDLTDMVVGNGVYTFHTAMPEDWAESVDRESAKVLKAGSVSVVSASLLRDENAKVTVMSAPMDHAHSRRLLYMVHRLDSLWRLGACCEFANIARYYETHVHPDKLFVLMETTDGDLEQLLREHEVRMPNAVPEPFAFSPASVIENLKAEWAPWTGPAMDLDQALLLLVDVLRGVRDLDTAGIVHANIAPETVLHKDGRAIIAGLGDACVLQDGEPNPELHCFGVADAEHSVVGSAFLQAPEMVLGAPTGPSNHAWAAGLLLARMLFGYHPTENVIRQQRQSAFQSSLMDSQEHSRTYIRQTLRSHFRIEDDPTFRFMDKSVQSLLRGLLDHDPETRWTSAHALDFVEQLLRRRAVEIPEPRRRDGLPEGWRVESPEGLRP